MSSPALPLDSIVDVVVTVSPTSVQPPSFNQGLIVGGSGIINSQTDRLKLYTSASGLLADGFPTSAPEYLAALIFFAQNPASQYLWVGAQEPTGLRTIAPHGANQGTGYNVGDVLTVVQGGAINGQVQVTTLGASGAVTGVVLLSSGKGYAVANSLATTGGTGTGAQMDISAIGESALLAVTACRARSSQWYEFSVLGATDADIQALALWTQSAAPKAAYFYQSAGSAILNNTTGNLAALLHAQEYDHVVGIYSTDQGGLYPNNLYAGVAIMGYVCGATTQLANSYFTLKFKQLVGITPEPLTEQQVSTLAGSDDGTVPGLGINVYVGYGNAYQFLVQGRQPDLTFFDVTLNLDILQANIQYGVMNLFSQSLAVPQTDPGQTQILTQVNAAADISATIGFLAAGAWNGVRILALLPGAQVPSGYLAQSPRYSTQAKSNRDARQAMPVYLAILTAGAVHSIVIQVLVQ